MCVCDDNRTNERQPLCCAGSTQRRLAGVAKYKPQASKGIRNACIVTCLRWTHVGWRFVVEGCELQRLRRGNDCELPSRDAPSPFWHHVFQAGVAPAGSPLSNCASTSVHLFDSVVQIDCDDRWMVSLCKRELSKRVVICLLQPKPRIRDRWNPRPRL